MKQYHWINAITGFFLINTVLFIISALLWIHWPEKKEVYHFENTYCDTIVSECTALNAQGERIILKLDVTPLQQLAPVDICLQLHNLEAEQAKIQFRSPTSKVSINELDLLMFGNQLFLGKTALPTTPSSKNQWQIDVTLSTPEKQIVIPFLYTLNQANPSLQPPLS